MVGGKAGCGPPMAACAATALMALVCGLVAALLELVLGPQLDVASAAGRDVNDADDGGGGANRLCGPGAMPAMAYGMRF